MRSISAGFVPTSEAEVAKVRGRVVQMGRGFARARIRFEFCCSLLITCAGVAENEQAKRSGAAAAADDGAEENERVSDH